MKTNLTTNLDLTQYANYLTNKSKSPNTIKSYLTHIGEYFSNFPQLTRSNILSFKKHLQSKSQASISINAKLSELKSYNEYLISINELNSLFIIKDDFISIQKQNISPTKFDTSDIEKLMNKVIFTETKRNIALIYLLLSTGLRRDEAVTLKLSNIDFQDESITLIGKGEKERTIYLNERVITVLKSYINTERRESKYNNSKYLFTTERSNKMHKETVNKIMNPYNINPHALRHFFASNALNSGEASIVEVGNMLGHSSINTTSKYLHPTLKEMKKKINNMTFCF